jgi:hypothetical protein
MQDAQLVTAKDKLGYAEEYIIVKEAGELLKYSLSNSLDDIKIAIYARTGLNIDLDKAYWQQNQKLSISVKYLMNIHQVNYSMTTYIEEKYRIIIINLRVGGIWLQTFYEELDGKIYSFGSYFNYLCKRYYSEKDDDSD